MQIAGIFLLLTATGLAFAEFADHKLFDGDVDTAGANIKVTDLDDSAGTAVSGF